MVGPDCKRMVRKRSLGEGLPKLRPGRWVIIIVMCDGWVSPSRGSRGWEIVAV